MKTSPCTKDFFVRSKIIVVIVNIIGLNLTEELEITKLIKSKKAKQRKRKCMAFFNLK